MGDRAPRTGAMGFMVLLLSAGSGGSLWKLGLPVYRVVGTGLVMGFNALTAPPIDPRA